MRALQNNKKLFFILFFAMTLLGIVHRAQAADPRLTLPYMQLNTHSWKDGFLLEHATVADYGFNAYAKAFYSYHPFGTIDLQDKGPDILQPEPHLTHRLGVILMGNVSIKKLVDLRISLPGVIYNDGLDLGNGDIRFGVKFNLPLPAKFKYLPKISLSADMAYSYANNLNNAYVTAGPDGKLSGFVRLILETPHFDDRFFVTANIGGIFAGQDRVSGGKPGTGLGYHLIWGLGASAKVAAGTYVTTEFVGGVTFTNLPTQHPVTWTLGAQYVAPNKLSAMLHYTLGLTDNAPGHTVGLSIGYIFELQAKKEPPKKDVEIYEKDGKARIKLVEAEAAAAAAKPPAPIPVKIPAAPDAPPGSVPPPGAVPPPPGGATPPGPGVSPGATPGAASPAAAKPPVKRKKKANPAFDNA